jgi:hypothetical protein
MSNPYTPDFEKKPCAYCKDKGKAARCHACNHTGMKNTKRGDAARRYFITLLTKPAADLKLGNMMWFRDGNKKVASPIRSLETEGHRIRVVGYSRREDREITNYLVANTRVEMAFDGPELLELTRQAEAYQATLNKDGSVSRRIKRAA